jgi:tetratricopeptide (TPR) repeat protein
VNSVRTHKIFVAEHLVDTSIPDVAKSYGSLGNVYNSQGQYERALEDYQKSLDITIRVFGAASYQNIGIVYGKKGDRAAATEMYTKAYHIFLTVLGPHHPQTQGLKPFVAE